MPRSLDTFDNYRQITARFDSEMSCGHRAIKGDPIGYNPRTKKTICACCWERWCCENEEADHLETYGGY